jgi:hypothetical protein
MATTTRACIGIYLYRVEGGVPGSMHRRGPWWYATEEEARAVCARDAYPARHPACVPTDVGLDYTAVELPAWVLPALRACQWRGKQEEILVAMWLVERVDGWPENTTQIAALGRRVLELHPE